MKKSFQLLPFVFPAAFLFSLRGGQVLPGIEDDAFFYCRIADKFVSRGVMSFDGITATSGFHPIWMMLLSGMRLLVTGQYPFILAVVVLSTLLMGFSGYLFLSAFRKYSPTVVLLLFILLARYIRDFSIMSMETSVLLPLAFLLLMRLDSLLLSVPALVLLLRRAGRRGLASLLLPGLVGGAAIY